MNTNNRGEDMSKYYYAVKDGKEPGIYKTWKECEEQVKGHSGAIYKKFTTEKEAEDFIGNKVELKGISREKVEIEKEAIIEQSDLKYNEAIAYVDGSFDLSNFTYSYGVVFITKDGKETFSGREDKKDLAEMRNVSGELKGAMVAMAIALERKIDTLYLHFDYTGIEQWAEGNWKTNKEGTRAYKGYYDSIKEKLKVIFIKVKAHSGIEYNEEADQLAKEAIMGSE